jgi:hypothetical protein
MNYKKIQTYMCDRHNLKLQFINIDPTKPYILICSTCIAEDDISGRYIISI